MSLKGFHILFITVAVLFSFGFCAWTFFGPDHMVTPILKAGGCFSAVAGLALAFYGIKFIQRSKDIII